jgi:hypothetical protein
MGAGRLLCLGSQPPILYHVVLGERGRGGLYKPHFCFASNYLLSSPIRDTRGSWPDGKE